jgi:hypothetical protein
MELRRRLDTVVVRTSTGELDSLFPFLRSGNMLEDITYRFINATFEIADAFTVATLEHHEGALNFIQDRLNRELQYFNYNLPPQASDALIEQFIFRDCGSASVAASELLPLRTLRSGLSGLLITRLALMWLLMA